MNERMPLNEFITLQRGFDLPSSKRKDGIIPVVASTSVNGYHHEAKVVGPGVVIGRSGSIGGGQYIDCDFWPLNTTLWVKDFKGHNPKYVYYLLKSIDFSRFNAGAGVPTLNRNHLVSIKVKILKKSEEITISDFLTGYDDLIENNRRRIQLLEESARLLYQEWFIHLRFPGHEQVTITDGVPEGWEKKPIRQIATLNYGKALKAEVRLPGPFPVYGSGGEVGSHDKALVKGPGLVVGRKGNVGSIFWVNMDFHPIDTVYFISAEESSLFLYHALKNVQFINTDVAVPGLNRDMAYSREILVPDDKNYERFLLEVIPIQEQVNKLQDYNNKLAQARDLLLPKLMSGELTV
ncbi:MAG: restriction endonuclease subunit S [Paraglaciecola chathamensis]